MASVLIVRCDFVHTAPRGFKKYIEEYFNVKTILGYDCMVSARFCNYYGAYGKGAAPSHSMDVREYSEGLPNGQSLGDFIRDKVKEGMYMWEFYGGDDPHQCGGYDD